MSINSSFGAKEGHINDTLGTLNFWGQRIGKTGPLTSSEMTENSQWNKHILVVGLIPAPSLRTLETASTMCAIKITMNQVQFSLINQKAVVWKVRILMDKHSRSWKPDAIFYEKKKWSKSCYILIKMDKKNIDNLFLKRSSFSGYNYANFQIRQYEPDGKHSSINSQLNSEMSKAENNISIYNDYGKACSP